jgi:hypothetical protein
MTLTWDPPTSIDRMRRDDVLDGFFMVRVLSLAMTDVPHARPRLRVIVVSFLAPHTRPVPQARRGMSQPNQSCGVFIALQREKEVT